jgi:hypothetical protein
VVPSTLDEEKRPEPLTVDRRAFFSSLVCRRMFCEMRECFTQADEDDDRNCDDDNDPRLSWVNVDGAMSYVSLIDDVLQ